MDKRKFFYPLKALSNIIQLPALLHYSSQKIIFPFYHIVADHETPHITHLYPTKTIAQFTSDLDYLLKYYEPLHLKDFTEKMYDPQKNYFVLSFDDGLREFGDVAAPLLHKKGIPAICFLNSSFVDNKKIFYRHEISLWLSELSNRKDLPALIQDFSKQTNLRFDNFNMLKKFVLNLTDLSLIGKLFQKTDFSSASFLQQYKPYLSSYEILKLIQDGFSFGAHSADHLNYQHLSLEQQIHQTESSIQFVQENFKLKSVPFSFPFTDYGVSKAFFDYMNRDAKNPWVCSFACAGLQQESIKNHFQRIPMEVKDKSCEEIIYTEYLYYIFKRFFGVQIKRV